MPEAAEQLPAEGEQKQDLPDYEKAARADGWRPKEELGDEFDAARYVGAEEFIKRKPLFDTIKQQNKKIKELSQTVESVVNFSQKNAELAAKRAIADLNSQKKEAVRQGDVETVESLDKTIKEHEAAAAQATQTVKKPEIAPAVQEWIDKNEWFEADKEMQDFATSFCKAYADTHPKASMDEALDKTLKAVKNNPDFADKKWFKSKRNEPAPVEGHDDNRAADAGGLDKKYRNAKLSEEQELCCKAYVKEGVFKTRADYIKALDEQGGLAK